MRDYIRLAAQRPCLELEGISRPLCEQERQGRSAGKLEESDKWEEAMSAAVTASQDFIDAETKRQTQLTDEANSIVEEAMAYLKRSAPVDTIPILDKQELIMSGWDEEEVEKA